MSPATLAFLLFVDYFTLVSSCVWDPQEHSPSSMILHETHRTEHVVIFRAMIYYGKRTQSKINKGKDTWVKSGKTGCKLPKVLSLGGGGLSHRLYLISPVTSCDNMCDTLCTRETD